jgi:dipeptidase D
MDDATMVHGPLELLFTIDEETGLTGALGLDPALLKGRLLLNMDSEEDGMLYVGCAGGQHIESWLPVRWNMPKANSVGAVVRVSGLMGGHSGADIHKNRGNAIKLLARSASRLMDSSQASNEIALASMSAGTAHNAIPRDGDLLLAIAADRLDWLREQVAAVESAFKAEFPNESKLSLTVVPADAPARVLEPGSAHRLVSMLLGFHNGVFAMSRDIQGLVETSNSLALVQTRDDDILVLNSTRSSQPDALDGLLDQNEAVARLAGARSERSDGYPGWQPNMHSPLLNLAKAKFSERFGQNAIITAIHAGLECGLIGERFDGMDMLSFGPEIQNPHSPDERVWIPSIERFWLLLGDILTGIAKKQLG